MSAILAETEVIPNARVVYRDLAEGQGGVLLHLDTTAYHGLNPVGALVWSCLGEGAKFGDLMVKVREALEEPPEDLETEIGSFLNSLAGRDLLEIRSGP